MVIKEEKKNQTERKKPHQCDIRASNDAENVCSHYGNPTKEDFVTFQPQTTQKRFVYIVFLAWRLHDVIFWRQIKQRGDMRTSSFNNAFVSKINTEDHTHHTETTRLAVERFLHVKALTAPIGLSGRGKTPGKDWKVYVKHAELNKNISHHNLVTLLMSVLDWKQPYTRYRAI